jgi:hypothetical protein
MKLKGLIFSCLLISLIFSCSQGSTNKNTKNGSETREKEVLSSTNDVALADSEEFDKFIQKFSTEESFQIERIKFPINIIVPDAGHEGMAPMHETIGKYDWEMIDLSYDSTFLTRPYDQYYQAVRFTNDTAVVEIRGIDNGIYADYYFSLINKKWYLVTLYEASF